MFNPLEFLGGGSYLGVDIGTTAIKIVEMSGKGKPQIVNYGILETHGYLNRQNAAIQTGNLKAVERETAALLRRLVEAANFKAQTAIASLPAFLAFVTVLEIPQMPEPDVEKTLQFQIPQYIPMAAEEAVIDWISIGETTDETGRTKKQILLIAVPKDAIERYKKIFRAAGLRLGVLEVESLSLIRALRSQIDRPTIIADIGSRATNICVASQNFLLKSVQTDFAGASLTQGIASGLGISMKRAEDLKRERGVRFDAQNEELSTLTSPFLGVILNEIKKAEEAFYKSSGSKIEKIIIAGGTARTIGLIDYFAQHFEVPVVLGDPFMGIAYDSKIEPLVKELGSTLSVAVGLGIRELTK